MRMVDLIMKKRNKEVLTDDEWKFIINGLVNGKVADYQMSALAMAIIFNGMEVQEIASLTKHMMHSGDVIDLSGIKGIKVDKHSTGGIGDKTTIAVAPIVSSLGAIVAKMSGRGLGNTGGTLDKLESIPNFKIKLSEKEFIEQVKKINIAIIGQTKLFVPADKTLYALRDVTATVDSIGLIASSIMSKKLATGSDAIILDVKCGNGAFIQSLEKAKDLATTMINVGKKLNRDVRAIITDMNRPLGKEIGNKNEILEAVKLLKGSATKDFKDVVYEISSNILIQSKIANSKNEAFKLIDKTINTGKALDKFKEWITAQNGDVNKIFEKNFWFPNHKLEIFANKSGYMEIKLALNFGNVAMSLGAGRETQHDVLDNEAGITINKKTNDKVQKGDLLFTLYSSNKINEKIVDKLKCAYSINNQKVETNIIIETLI